MWRRLAIPISIAGASLWIGAAGCSSPEPRADALVLVVIDTLRADRLFDPQVPRWSRTSLTPWLDRARVYDRAYASSSWTLPSFASMYTGQIPSRHGAGQIVGNAGARDFTAIATDLDGDSGTLAERLSRHGFSTGAVVGNPALAPDFGMDRGFDEYDYTPATNREMLRANLVVERSLAFVDRHADEPFFLVVHLFDPHMNYDAPPPYRGRFTSGTPSAMELPVGLARKLAMRPDRVGPRDRAFVAAAYDEEVAFAGDQLSRLLAGLQTRGVLERGLVAITSDHGEEHFEHEGFEHGHALWEEVVHVPLAFLGSEVRPGRDASPVSLADLAPTLLAAAGLPPPKIAAGASLWPGLRDGSPLPPRPLFIEGTLYGPEQKAVVEWPYKLVWWPEQDRDVLFDLSLDPGEREPIEGEAGTRERLLALLRNVTGDAANARGDASGAGVRPETLEALRALGYAE